MAETAAFLAVTEKEVFRLSESDVVQSAETDDGRLLICLSCASRIANERVEEQKVLFIAEVAK